MKKKKLSSNITVIYKFIIPIGLLVLMMGLNLALIFNTGFISKETLIPLDVFFCFFSLFLIPLIKLKKVEYDNKYLYVSNYYKQYRITNKNIKKVKRHLIYFYKITYYQNGIKKSMIFLPHINEVFFSFFSKPRSIKEFEKLIY